ncbi:hypothetical protein M2407_000119 [Serratia sp. BIGb0234]|jgi:hypothetical protein|uniref:hypothetical protein n=1 Tax=Serratia sp. BIGb0234 TaxID=2940614 RepID=UPI00216A380B|nr:hypothetical protein [Serratia sp. BIGb0234]MCS4315820.1 hypothetical protein [Serratia sp. BIGb0234]
MEKKPLPPSLCEPRYHIGTIVNYSDHRGKDVQGQIVSACARWTGFKDGSAYVLTYAITHPSTSRLQHHSESTIHGEVE